MISTIRRPFRGDLVTRRIPNDAVEIVSRHGNAVLVSAEDYAALREGAYLGRSPANARRLLKAYEHALNGIHVAEHDLVDPDAADAR